MNESMKTKGASITQAIMHCILYFGLLLSYIGVVVANLIGLNAKYWIPIIFVGMLSGMVISLIIFQKIVAGGIIKLTALMDEEKARPRSKILLPEKVNSPELGKGFLITFAITFFIFLPILFVLMKIPEQEKYIWFIFPFLSAFSALVVSILLFMVYQEYESGNAVSVTRKHRRRIDVFMKITAFSLAFVPMFLIGVNVFLANPWKFHQEYLKVGDGIVETVLPVRGGYSVEYENGNSFYLLSSLSTEIPQKGDYFQKENKSFRYMLNGRNVSNANQALQFLFWPCQSGWIIALFIGMIVFQWIFFIMYGNSFFTAWRILEIFNSQLNAPLPTHPVERLERYLCLTPLPVAFAWYLFCYFMMEHWTA